MYELNDEDLLTGKQLRALSEATRFKIIKLLLEKHRCSRSLALELNITESAVSQHMAILRDAGLVYRYRHRHHIHYEVNLDALTRLRTMLDSWIDTASHVGDCHTTDPCSYERPDGTLGCLYGTIEAYRRENLASDRIDGAVVDATVEKPDRNTPPSDKSRTRTR